MEKVNMSRSSSSESFRMSGNQNQLTDMVRKKAYELYEKRGHKPGHSMDDWLEAERIVKSKAF